MDISTKHDTARETAARLPALTASLALLAEDSQLATIALYGTTRPDPGDPPGAAAIVTISLTSAAGTIDEEEGELVLATPIEGQVTGADPDDGTEALWARITDGAGDWWADCSVSETGEGGELQIEQTLCYQGAYVRITDARFAG